MTNVCDSLLKPRSAAKRPATTFAILVALTCAVGSAQETDSDRKLAQYFKDQTERITDSTFAEIETLEDWTSRRDEYRRQLLEMLGLDPLPEKTPLEAETTGTVEAEEFFVENVHFQSRPGLYVTGNLYRPKQQANPLPAILYVCGHGRVKKDGISYGNKTHYQHHGAWFARNGYVCLTIDTIQLGEIEGIHHGTYREKMWWWNNRGYTPAGVEAWNCVRSIDYLQSRDEVDPERIGVTGRSGGGAYSWWVAAIDERIKAAVPVAGITSLHNHVVDGCVEGHCDCMYMVNTYRWDYPMIAALVAPRPLLISNTDKDRIFPLDGVVDVHKKTRKIYDLYGAGKKLGLHITEGPHKDTQELRIHAFRWFNRFLRDDDTLIDVTATKFFEPEELQVFDDLPADERVTNIHESFVPAVSRDDLPSTRDEFSRLSETWMSQLTERTFRGWPTDENVDTLRVRGLSYAVHDAVRVRSYQFTSQEPYDIALMILEAANSKKKAVRLQVLPPDSSAAIASGLAVVVPHTLPSTKPDPEQWAELVEMVDNEPDTAFAYFRTRGNWNGDERKVTQIRRRFMQVGQTADGMKIWDVRRAIQAIGQIDGLADRPLIVAGEGHAAAHALFATLYEQQVDELQLNDLPSANRAGITLLNVSRFVEVPQVLLMAADRVNKLVLTVPPEDEPAWRNTLAVSKALFNDPHRIVMSITPAR